MNADHIRTFLGWCCVLDFGILMVWFLAFTVTHDQLHALHGKWFRLSEETFDAIHYAGMAVLKLGAFVLHLVPYVALVLMG